jgi:PST family polysaccharide transporter
MTTDGMDRYQIWFSRDQLRKDIKRKSLQSAVNKITANGVSFALSIASTMILARLLPPSEFGLLAMVTSVTEYARSFRELGLGTLTVQRDKITHDEISTLFWINFGIGFLLMLILICLSPLLVWFYGEKRLFGICIAMSLIFIFGGLTVQHRALLERQMRFGYLGTINVASAICGFVASTVLALQGFGVWALVSSAILSTALYALGTWLCCGWLPSISIRKSCIKSYLQFGSDVSIYDLVQYVSRNLDRILIGRWCGAANLGLYSKIFQLAMMPIEQIRIIFWDIGLSPLSALQNEENRYRHFYSRMLSIMSFLYMPMVVLIIIRAESIIWFLLGENWLSGAPILRLVAIGGFFKPVLATFQLVLISCNQTRRYMKWGLLSGCIMIVAFTIGILGGLQGIAYSYAVASYIILWGSLKYCTKEVPLDKNLIFKTIKIPLLASCSTGTLVGFLLPTYHYPSSICSHIVKLITFFIITYCSMLFLIPACRRQISVIWAYRKELMAKA